MSGRASQGQVLVIGGGRFGRLAVERLGPRVCLVVEPDPGPELEALGAPVLAADGIAAASELLEQPQAPDWVVPALPLHFVGEWLLLCLADQEPRLLPVPRESLPPAAWVGPGQHQEWYLSLADFLCPDDCPEPARVCTVTGQPRGEPMYQRLASIRLPGFQTVALRSRQLAPGVGGLRREELMALRGRLAQGGAESRWVIATACRCHGVVQALALKGAAA